MTVKQRQSIKTRPSVGDTVTFHPFHVGENLGALSGVVVSLEDDAVKVRIKTERSNYYGKELNFAHHEIKDVVKGRK